MRTKLSLTVLLIAAFLLSACGGGATAPTSTPLPPLPTSTFTPAPPTATFTITPSPTPTNTPFVPRLTLKIVSNSPADTDIARAAELAVMQLSMPLQEMGIKIEYVAYDDKQDIDTALTNARQIVDDPLVMCGVGHYTSRVSINASDLYHLAGLPFISPSSTNPNLTDRGYPEIFRTTGRDDNQGVPGALFAASKGFKNVFVVTSALEYSLRPAQDFKAQAGPSGLTIVGDFSASVEQGNYAAVVEKLLTSNADAVYFSGLAHEAGPFFKLAREAGYMGALIGPDGLDSSALVETGGPLLGNGAGTFYSSPVTPASYHPNGPAFVEAFQAQFGAPPQPYAAEAYDAATICLKAIENAAQAKGGEAPTRAEVTQAIHALQNFQGLTGVFTFSENGDPLQANYYVFQVTTADPAKWGDNPLVATYQIAPPE